MLFAAACDQSNMHSITVMEDIPNSDRTELEANSHIIKLGFIGPITGPVAAEGIAARNAFEMAVDDANNSGRFPYKIEIIIIDDKSDESAAIEGAKQLVADPLVVAVSGFWNSGPAAAAIPIFKEAKVPLLIWGAIREGLTGENNVPYITRSAPTATQENIPLARAVLDEMGYADWFIVSDESAYGAGNYEAFLKELSARDIVPLGVKNVYEDAPFQESFDFSEIIREIRSSRAKAVYCGSISSLASMLKQQLYDAGLTDILFCGISGIKTNEFFNINISAAEGTLVISPGVILSDSEQGRRFIEIYNANGYNEPIGAYTPYAYEAALILLNSLSFCSTEPSSDEMIAAIIRSSTTGIMGNTAFNEIGQTMNIASYLTVAQDGVWTPFQNSEYSTGVRVFGGR